MTSPIVTRKMPAAIGASAFGCVMTIGSHGGACSSPIMQPRDQERIEVAA